MIVHASLTLVTVAASDHVRVLRLVTFLKHLVCEKKITAVNLYLCHVALFSAVATTSATSTLAVGTVLEIGQKVLMKA